MTLIIIYTDRNDKLRRKTWTGEPMDRYMLNGNLIQGFEIDGRAVSYADAFNFINERV